MRIFTGLPLPTQAAEEVGHWAMPWRTRLKGWRWVDPALYHISLHFFGELDPEQLEMLRQDLPVLKRPPIHASFGETGCFGRPPRVLYLGLGRGGREVAALQAIYATRIADLGFEPEGRRYVPHITLARARRRAGDASGNEVTGSPGAELAFDRIVLFESRLGRGGPAYLPVETVMFEEIAR